MDETYWILTEAIDLGEDLVGDDGEVVRFPDREAADAHRQILDDPRHWMCTWRVDRG